MVSLATGIQLGGNLQIGVSFLEYNIGVLR